jgi:hypothetical protein
VSLVPVATILALRLLTSAPALAPGAAIPESVPPLRIVAYSAGAAGVLMVAAGVYFGLRVIALDRKSDAQAARGMRDPAVVKDARNVARWQWVGYAVGAAFLAGGGLAYHLSRRPAVSVAPVLAPGAAGAALGMRF